MLNYKVVQRRTEDVPGLASALGLYYVTSFALPVARCMSYLIAHAEEVLHQTLGVALN